MCREMVESFDYQVETIDDNTFRAFVKDGKLDCLEVLRIVKAIVDGQNKANLRRWHKRQLKWIYHFHFEILDEQTIEISFKSYKEYIQAL